jgi:acetyl-CoA carboxylase carboxyltransferase component
VESGAADPLAELRAREARLVDAGRPEDVERQHRQGKLTARERLALLFDPGTFTELGLHVRHRGRDFGLDAREIPADAVVTGFGTVEGRTVYAFAQDFTALGGTVGEMHAAKIVRVQELALAAGAPLVGINDSGGARIHEGIDALHGYARIFRANVLASGVVPQISVILGPCAGGAVYSPALTDFVFMVDGPAQMYITGPDVVRAVLREEVTHQELGGGRVHATRSGVCHFLYADEPSCLAGVRRLLGYLPSNNLEDPPLAPAAPPVDSPVPELRAAVPADPQRGYDVRTVIRAIVDPDSFFEVQAEWACSAVVGLARLGGRPLGVVANQPRVAAGCLDIDSSDKIARFVRTCDCFNLPLLTLVDTPGYLPGIQQEHGGIIRHGAKVLYAYAEATVPKVSVVLRKAYGGAYIAMCSRGLGADLAAAWPGAEIAVMGPEGACNIIFAKEIRAADDPETVRARRVAEYRAAFANPYVAAARQYVDAVIDPAETRAWVARALAAVSAKRQELPAKKHGNLPV